MSTILVTLVALAATAVANPIDVQNRGLHAFAAPHVPIITPAPTLTKRDGPSVTTLSLSNCRVYQDPHEGESGCSCDGYGSLLSMTSSAGSTCDYSTIVTATDTSSNGFPYTKTYSNSGITAYAQSTVLQEDPDNWYGKGSSTVIQAGTSLSLEMAPSSSVNVGTVTDGGSSLFTAVSSAIASACPPPSQGATLSACAKDAKVTGLTYVDVAEIYRDGTLDIEIPIASVSDANVLTALIAFIAAGIQSNAASSGNQATLPYECDKSTVPVCQELRGWNVTLANAPARMQAIYSEQTANTKGEVVVQNLEVLMTMKAGGSDFRCSDAGTALSVVAAVASIVPGLGWLSGGVVGSVSRAGLSLTCNLEGS